MAAHSGCENRDELRKPDFFDTEFAKVTARLAMGLAPFVTGLSIAFFGAMAVIQEQEKATPAPAVVAPTQELTK